MIQGHVRGETIGVVKAFWWLSSGFILVWLGRSALHFRNQPNDNLADAAISRDRLISAAIVSMPVLMPYYMDYDLLLMAIPAVLFAAEWVRRPSGITKADHWLAISWALFCIETHINPGLAGNSHWNIAVPLLTLISVLHIARLQRKNTTRLLPIREETADLIAA